MEQDEMRMVPTTEAMVRRLRIPAKMGLRVNLTPEQAEGIAGTIEALAKLSDAQDEFWRGVVSLAKLVGGIVATIGFYVIMAAIFN